MNPCVVIPVYNHGEALVGTLENLAGYALPTIVVDDGSDERTKAIVADLAANTDIELVSPAAEPWQGWRGHGWAQVRPQAGLYTRSAD